MSTESKRSYKILKLIVAAVAVMVFQFFYNRLMEIILINGIATVIKGLSNSCYLMLHHFIQFGILFVPTFILHRKNKGDWGYHRPVFSAGRIFILLGAGFGLGVSLVTAIMGNSFPFALDDFLFQLFFSGLGEEILFRSLPLLLFWRICGHDFYIEIAGKVKIDVAIVISAFLFVMGHVSISKDGISFASLQLFCCFVMGIILGYCFKKTKNIWICMLIHGIYNICVTAFNSLLCLF